MIRGVLSTLSTRLTHSLNVISLTNKSGPLTSVSKSLIYHQSANFTSVAPAIVNTTLYKPPCISKCSNRFLEPNSVFSEQIRTLVKYSWKKGTRKSIKSVRKRFLRLHCCLVGTKCLYQGVLIKQGPLGIWIRTIAGRRKKLWNKSARRRNNLTKHVFCNATQSRLLDKMVTKFWRKPKYYIEDPYEPYHKRDTFHLTRNKPWRPEGVDYE